MYQITYNETSQDFDTRVEAIEAAKQVSSEGYQDVQVSDPSGRESMVYRGGALESYIFETRPSHRR